MTKMPPGPRVGVVLLQAEHAVDTVDWPDPFSAPAPPGLPLGAMANPDTWPVPTAFAIAGAGTTVPEIIKGTPSALAGVAAAVDRLAKHCDVIVGNCGYMHAARSLIQSDTPTLLSGLELLPNALESCPLPVGILTFNQASTERMLADHPDRSRLRIVGLDHQPAWADLGTEDYMRRLNVDQIRTELLEVCSHERQAGAFTDVGSIVLECTALPMFRPDLVAALALPIWDIASVAKALLGA